MRHLILSLLFSLFIVPVFAQYEDPTPEELMILEQLQVDTIPGQTGVISLDVANCTLKVPEGFVFLDKEASKHLIVDYWNNPEKSADEIIGALVNDYAGYFYNVDIAYIIMYDDSGYVSDEDANSIDYDDLLKSIQDGLKEENEQNPSEPQWELLDWAWQPTYDSQKKVLGWAKHFRIDGEREVINYDIRVLGKSGFVLIKAVADPEFKEQLMADKEAIINSVEYNEGFRYSDFDPDTDHVAEWTIGGLIAGKVLAKAGIWAILAKFSKLIIVAVVGFLAAMRKRLAGWFGFGKKERRKEDKSDNI